MGRYQTFTANEEEVMESFLKFRVILKSETSDYSAQIKKLLRNKFIVLYRGKYYSTDRYFITSRGASAIIQFIKTGQYWVAPLRTYRGVVFEQLPLSELKRMRGY